MIYSTTTILYDQWPALLIVPLGLVLDSTITIVASSRGKEASAGAMGYAWCANTSLVASTVVQEEWYCYTS